MSNASRWRRFGFFDRSTLSLPDDVWDDLVPEEALREIGQKKTGRSAITSSRHNDETAALKHTQLLLLGCATVSFHPSLLPAPKLEKVGETVMSACLPSSADGSANANINITKDQLTISTAQTGNNANTPMNAATAYYYTCGLQLATLGNRNRAFLTCGAGSGTPHSSAALSPLNGSLAFAYCAPISSTQLLQQPMSPVMEKMSRMFQSACTGGGACVADGSVLDASALLNSSPENLAGAAATIGTLVLAFVASPHSGLVHCVDVSMRCHPLSKEKQATATTSRSGAGAAVDTDSSGILRNSLYNNEAASPDLLATPDRKTAAGGSDAEGEGESAHKKQITKAGLPALADQMSTITMEELEDLDGWRGYVNPFVKPDSAAKQQASVISAKDRIMQEHMADSTTRGSKKPPALAAMAIYSTSREARQTKSAQALLGKVIFGDKENKGQAAAAASDPSSKPKGGSSKRKLQDLVGHLYVAVASNDLHPTEGTGVCLMVDPHLHLETDILAAGGDGGDASGDMVVYRPRVATKHRYKFKCMDVCPPMLVVGTTVGVTLVYQFTPVDKIIGQKSPQKLDLVLKMEIPPPGISMKDLNSSMRDIHSTTNSPELRPVVSVKLAQDDTANQGDGTAAEAEVNKEGENKDKQLKGSTGLKIGNASLSKSGPSHLYVCYGRGVGGSASTSSVGGGGGDAGGKSAPASAATTGVCCYNLLHTVTTTAGSTGSSTTAAIAGSNVPRSRIDLDGRTLPSQTLTDVMALSGNSSNGNKSQLLQVCWSDGLYTYSPTNRLSAIPMEGTKLAFCALSGVQASDNTDDEPLGVARKRMGAGSNMDDTMVKEVSQQAGVDPGKTAAFLVNTTNSTSPQASSSTASSSSMAYSLVATSDGKSGRDAVDIYDTTNKLCAFHVLLSPNHRATQVAGVCTPTSKDGRKGRNSAIVMTSGGAVITLTEKDTSEKVALLLEKDLYAAAISLAFMDPYYPTSDVMSLYRQHAEFLYGKGDFDASMEQYLYTIGSIEPSHVIFRFLDAPKIPLLVKYLEELRSRNMASHVHMELLRTCYLKLNDLEAAEKIAASSALGGGGDGKGGGGGLASSSSSVAVANLVADRPAEALATLCALEAPQVAEALRVHGATLSRSLPRETAGIVMALCDGTFSSEWAKQSASSADTSTKKEPNNLFKDNRPQACDKYPASLFVNAFVEHPKLLRLVLAHCKRNHCDLEPSLRRTHLELTLEEWNFAKRTSDYEMERIRSKEAMTALTDAHAEDLGVYEALVLVHQAKFTTGEILIYEKLQMTPMLLERYAELGGERERRQMIAMCNTDPELLADVMAYFVDMASKAAKVAAAEEHKENTNIGGDDDSTTLGGHETNDAVEDIYEDLRETLEMARTQGVLLPIRVTRILAGEGPGQFSDAQLLTQLRDDDHQGYDDKKEAEDSDVHGGETWSSSALAQLNSVPLKVAMDYMGGVLDESSSELSRLKDEITEFTTSCNEMEREIKSLMALASGKSDEEPDPNEWYIPHEDKPPRLLPDLDIDDTYRMLQEAEAEGQLEEPACVSVQVEEEFWREMGMSEDRFETICRFFAKGIIH